MIRGLNKLTVPHGLGYVMSSYSAHPGGLEQAYKEAKEIAGALTASGLVVFVPVAYGPGIEPHIIGWEEDREYVQSHEFWMPIDERFYQRCDYGLIATTPGWCKSTGISIELGALTRAGKPVFFYDVDNQHIYNLVEYGEKNEAGFNELCELSAKNGIPLYLSEGVPSQAEGLCAVLADHMSI